MDILSLVQDNLRSLGAFRPELVLALGTLVLLMLDLGWKQSPRRVPILTAGALAVLGVAAAAGFVLGGGLWPLLRPFVKATARAALSPTNLLAVGAALGAMRAAGAQAEPEPGAAEPGGSQAH
ncbi:MAG TPA: hypothetical protein VD838_04400 [Anaeromyxobacteraceae bacterium]|nr:hypothetical protein [Anaeromyxobacteraceae bacterium]